MIGVLVVKIWMAAECKTSVIQSTLQACQEMGVFVQSLVQSIVDRINKCVQGESMMVVGNLINVGQKCPWDLKAKNAMNTVQLIAKMKKSW